MSDEIAKKHDEKMILESESFRAINVLIDQHLASLHQYEAIIKDKMEQLLLPPTYKPTISTRTYEENGKNIPRLFWDRELENLTDFIGDLKKQEEIIGDLVRYKLRLLNDWDFTRGDNSEQIAVFGEPK